MDGVDDFFGAHPALEYVFEMRVDFTDDRCIFGPLPGGGRAGYTPISGGTISGPRLSGRVIGGSGADFAPVRDDGVVEINSHYMLQADDGAMIYINNSGYLQMGGGPTVNGATQPRYFRFTPRFKVQDGPHAWLMRTVILGNGLRQQNPDHSIFRYYAVL